MAKWLKRWSSSEQMAPPSGSRFKVLKVPHGLIGRNVQEGDSLTFWGYDKGAETTLVVVTRGDNCVARIQGAEVMSAMEGELTTYLKSDPIRLEPESSELAEVLKTACFLGSLAVLECVERTAGTLEKVSDKCRATRDWLFDALRLRF